jgi:RNA polymerase sigma-70 factor (ECF subfamily)
MVLLSIARELLLSAGRECRADAAGTAMPMDEDAFRAFYERNARGLWAYLARVSGDRQLADDLLQETFYRFVRAGSRYESESHRRRSLFQIATNLVRDSGRRTRQQGAHVPFDEESPECGGPSAAGAATERTDLTRALARLKASERKMLWLAYGQGMSHREIAGVLRLKEGSIRLLLFRARGKLGRLLRGAGDAKKGRGR